jgi:DNA polymerase III alpha subunit (gram-positive type)
MREIYFSTDIEADGPVPSRNSMLSIGSAAFTADGQLISTFSANLLPLDRAAADINTTNWWMNHPQAWNACQQNRVHPGVAMEEFSEWVRGVTDQPVFVAHPVAFDFMYASWYLHAFVGKNIFGHSALDIKSFGMAALAQPFLATSIDSIARAVNIKLVNSHVALEDAIEQGHMFCKLLSLARGSI